jgi:hypothetical protein
MSVEHIVAAFYFIALLLAALCLARAHRESKINLWDMVTATDRAGKERTDGRKMFETGAFFVMTLTFAVLTVTAKLTEWYALIYVGAWVTARIFRDKAQMQQRLTDGSAPSGA